MAMFIKFEENLQTLLMVSQKNVLRLSHSLSTNFIVVCWSSGDKSEKSVQACEKWRESTSSQSVSSEDARWQRTIGNTAMKYSKRYKSRTRRAEWPDISTMQARRFAKKSPGEHRPSLSLSGSAWIFQRRQIKQYNRDTNFRDFCISPCSSSSSSPFHLPQHRATSSVSNFMPRNHRVAKEFEGSKLLLFLLLLLLRL